jgi:N utilization substance protein B
MSNPRTLARRCAVQAIYQWQLSGSNLADIERQFLADLSEARILFHRYRGGQRLSEAEQDMLQELLERYCRTKPQEAADDQDESQDLPALVAECCPPEIHGDYFKELLHAVPRELDRIDAAIGEFSDRPVPEIDPVERAILRLGAYELLFRPDLPYRVAVNEAINLAKCFGATQSHKFVNGILDRVARRHRAAETGPRNRS